ncbi:hypothetical protein GQ457_17G018800 [Hibiscus cannabinus]
MFWNTKRGNSVHLNLQLIIGGRRCKKRSFLKIELYHDPTTTLYYNQGLDDATNVLLVDGYNVCGFWVKLKKYCMKRRLDVTCQKLVDEHITFSMLRGLYLVVVFDVMMSGLPTNNETFVGTIDSGSFTIKNNSSAIFFSLCSLMENIFIIYVKLACLEEPMNLPLIK